MANPSVKIERAADSDVPAMAELLGLLLEQEEDFHPNVDKQKAGLRMIQKDPAKGLLLVAKEKGQVLGMVNLLYTISTAEGAPVILMEDLIVAPAFRRNGIGRQLLQEAIAHAKRGGFKRLTVLTDKMNAKAQALYSEVGFKASAMTPLRLNLSEI